jgi:toxin ParE1/3/4
MTFRLTVAPQAQRDMDGILAYTLAMWGARQFDTYQTVLFEAFDRITSAPASGRAFIGPFLKMGAGEHVIFYRVAGDTIRIARILHNRMDPLRHLEINE